MTYCITSRPCFIGLIPAIEVLYSLGHNGKEYDSGIRCTLENFDRVLIEIKKAARFKIREILGQNCDIPEWLSA